MSKTSHVLWPLLLGVLSCSPAGRAAGPTEAKRVEPSTEGPELSLYEKGSLLPAGLCFDPYLRKVCAGAPQPSFAVVLDPQGDPASAEKLIAAGKLARLPVGYPFAATFESMPMRDRARRGLVVVAGLFAERPAAEAHRQRLGDLASEIVELRAVAEGEWFSAADDEPVAVELLQSTPAWRTGRRNLGEGKPHCVLPRGRVFLVEDRHIYDVNAWELAPVRCDDGTEAWVPWSATRLQSVIVSEPGGAMRYQIIEVSCDTPAFEKQRVGADGALSESLGLVEDGWEDPC